MSLHGASKPAPIVSTTDEYVTRWRTVSKEQDQILSEVLQKNLELEARVKALEYDNWRTRTQLDKYKAERQTLDEKRRALKTEIEMMKSENDNFKVRSTCSPLSPVCCS
jgi:phage shock protein A